MDWVIEFDVAAFILTAMILGLFLKKKNYPSKANKMYLYLMLTGLSASLLDVISVYTITYARQIPLWVNLIVNALFLLSMNAITFIYYFYIDAIITEQEEVDGWHEWFMKVLAIGDFALIASSLFNGWVFYFDAQRNYCSGPFKAVVYGIALFMLIACLAKTFRHRDVLSVTQKNCVYIYTWSNLSAVIIQCIFPKLLITNFAIALAFLMIYIMLQIPENKIDALTQLENRVAFLEEVNHEVHKKKHFFLLAVKLENLDNINEMIGIVLANSVLRQFAQTLMDAAKEAGVYRISGAKFVYIGWSQEETQLIVDQIEDRVKKGFEVHDMVVQVKVKYGLAWYPQHGGSVKELENAIQYCLESKVQNGDEKVVCADEKMIENLKRKDEITGIIRRALQNHIFEVYYQPIYDWQKEKFESAEALIRLRDEKYGFISPDEFIPMAEKNGLIVEIGEYVLDEVCRTVSQTDILKYGIKRIHINLSAVQCMQRDLNERVQCIVEKYGVDPNVLCFEITETAALHTDSYLTKKLRGITDAGFKLILDDYGSGFATFGYLLQYPFSVVKFDKEMVWQATKRERALIALNYVGKMMKELGLEIVAEGVETNEQAEQLKQIGCDFFQGFLYAKPMPIDTFTEFLKEKNLKEEKKEEHVFA